MSTLKSKLPNLFLARIKDRVRLNPGSEKETYHIVVDLQGSGIQYSVGDCLGVYPENDPFYVKAIVEALGDPSLYHFFLKEVNLHRIPKKLLGEYPDLLTLVRDQKIEFNSLKNSLLPLLPRFYSIASSNSRVNNEAHLTVALSKNPPESPSPWGTCSHYLCRRAPLEKAVLPIFHQPSRHFFLPPESINAPIIMIGPGTGVAPFRGFMQERTNKNNWLFFGERHEKTDYYYRSFWEDLKDREHLRIHCAFSRDQQEKIYVQDKMMENGREIWEWLKAGAYVFVCGDASKMAKDVHHALERIIQVESKKNLETAKSYLKNLKINRRYQRDIY
ncbi:MAG: hypothetical protein R3E91_02595 [Chlamydiales bacterium]